jgi:hypothetical protein
MLFVGDEAPTYACVQRWSKRFRDAIDSPLGSPLASQANFIAQEEQSDQQLDSDSIDEGQAMHKQLNTNANLAESLSNMVRDRMYSSCRSTTVPSRTISINPSDRLHRVRIIDE